MCHRKDKKEFKEAAVVDIYRLSLRIFSRDGVTNVESGRRLVTEAK